MAQFELLDVALASDGWGTRTVSLDTRGGKPVALPEGAVISVAFTFQVKGGVDGLTLEETRRYGGQVIGTTRTALGGFRTGGPYELRLPPERMPVARANCGTYEVTGRFIAPDGHELARESHRFRIVPPPPPAAPSRRRSGTAGLTVAATRASDGPAVPTPGTVPTTT
ncbi:hypothetical protein ACIBG6_07695 [Streptomyces sp. NPDC050842]|uniref:hypothetical protein n=1 Tax=Streptomyces sp. NPDC050842 TaxID=3365636 RepID=UPI0037BA51DD